jgi:hypothetical protein
VPPHACPTIIPDLPGDRFLPLDCKAKSGISRGAVYGSDDAFSPCRSCSACVHEAYDLKHQTKWAAPVLQLIESTRQVELGVIAIEEEGTRRT